MLAVALGALVFLGAAALLGGNWLRPAELHGTAFPPGPPENFTLTSARGPVRLAEFRGAPVVLFFGYTSCPDVCPTTLSRLARATRRLGPRADRVRVVMVTVDPERDTPARLAEYTAAFDPRFIGLSGTPAQIDSVAAHFGIAHTRHPGSAAAGYTVDHTSSALVLGPDGSLCVIWPYDLAPEDMASDLRQLLRR